MTLRSYQSAIPLMISIVLMSQLIFAQSLQNVKIVDPKAHHEVPDDAYISKSAIDMKKSPAFRERGSFYFTNQVNVDEDGFNIEGDAANEPSIAVDPTNPDRMAIGWRQFDDVNNNFRQAGYRIYP